MSSRLRAAPFLLALSGASALMYETVWMRQLARSFGVTVYAVAGLVALYMAGLALGSALAARARGSRDWLRSYAWLELAAGACAVAASAWLARLPAFAASFSEQAPLSAAARLLLAAPALLPPTILLGATLPVLARDGADGALLYGANTLGALAGLLAAAFVTIAAWGETSTIALAAALNAAAAVGALLLSRKAVTKPGAPHARPRGAALAVPLFAASGFCALGCEVLWSRQFVPLLGNSTYAFAMILAVYLGGLGLGSCLKVRAPRPWTAFAALLAALGAAIVVSAAMTKLIGLSLASPDFLKSPLRSAADLPLFAAQAVIMVGPAALVLGLMFPVALGISGGDGASVGRLYAWNTVGGIAGSLFCGFAGFSLLGGHRALLLLGALALAAAVCAAASRGREAWTAVAGFGAVAAAGFLYAPSDPAADIVLRRLAGMGMADARVIFQDESPAATIIGTAMGDGRGLFINGIAVSGKTHVGEFVSLLPLVAARDFRSTLVICFGAGNTFRQASRVSERVDAVELVGDVVRRMPFFYDDAAEHLGKPSNRVFIEDGRNYLLRSKDRYDAIAVDAVPPLYSAGAVNLYTREFMDLARSHLNPGGVYALWLPSDAFESDYWQILRSLCDAFPHAAVWARPEMGGFLALGSDEPLEWPKGELDRRLRARAARALPWRDLDEFHVRRGFVLPEKELRAYAARFEPLTDDRPAVEFPLARFLRGEPLLATNDFLSRAAR